MQSYKREHGVLGESGERKGDCFNTLEVDVKRNICLYDESRQLGWEELGM